MKPELSNVQVHGACILEDSIDPEQAIKSLKAYAAKVRRFWGIDSHEPIYLQLYLGDWPGPKDFPEYKQRNNEFNV